MSGIYVQMMGTASKLIRFLIFILVGVIIWKLSYYAFPSQPTRSEPSIQSSVQQASGLDKLRQRDVIKTFPHDTDKKILIPDEKVHSVTPPLRIAVYYEALCPDSRDFIVRQLLPAYKLMSEVITVDLVPYGKAKSFISSNGRKTFDCQHGPKECKANMVHACVAKYVKNEDIRLHVVQCMIEINFREDPMEAGRKCLLKYKEDISEVEKCSLGTEGEELHFHMGKMTHDLEPPVSFIPTITINDSSENQPLILKNLVKRLCTVYSGPKHSACGT